MQKWYWFYNKLFFYFYGMYCFLLKMAIERGPQSTTLPPLSCGISCLMLKVAIIRGPRWPPKSTILQLPVWDSRSKRTPIDYQTPICLRRILLPVGDSHRKLLQLTTPSTSSYSVPCFLLDTDIVRGSQMITLSHFYYGALGCFKKKIIFDFYGCLHLKSCYYVSETHSEILR